MSRETCACAPVPRRWRQAPRQRSRICPRPKAIRSLLRPPLYGIAAMSTLATDSKMLVNALYHSAVVAGLAAGYAGLGKMVIGVALPPPKLDTSPRDVGIWSWWTSLSPWRPRTCLLNRGSFQPISWWTGAFSGTKWLFSILKSSGLDEERSRHDKAVEELVPRRQNSLENGLSVSTEKVRTSVVRGHAVQTYRGVDDAIREYWRVTGKHLYPLGPEPKLSDFYVRSTSQRDREIAFVVLGMAATGIIAYRLAK